MTFVKYLEMLTQAGGENSQNESLNDFTERWEWLTQAEAENSQNELINDTYKKRKSKEYKQSNIYWWSTSGVD